MELTAAALEFAHQAHQGQFREGAASLPYLHHPLEAAGLLFHIGGVTDPEEISAAILHDTIEEGGVSLAEIEERFGAKTGRLVSELTRKEPTPQEALGLSRDQLYELRTRLLLEGISRMSEAALRIKLADRLSNWREARVVRSKKKLDRYRLQTQAILAAIPRSVSPPLWDTLKAECSDA